MNRIGVGLALLSVAAVAGADQVAPAHSLGVTANAPTVEVSPRKAGRNYLRLPSLEYTFVISAKCAADFDPLSVSLSVADSRKTVPGDLMVDETKIVELKLSVPARQLAPLVMEGFCVATADDDTGTAASVSGAATVTVLSALSLQTALLCIDDDIQEIVYTSKPLDITLVCNAQIDATE